MTLASTLRENKAVYAVAGAGDFAVEKLREVPEQVGKARETATKYQGEVRETVDRYRVQVREAVDRYRGEVRENLDKVQDRVDTKDLPGAAVAYVTHVGTRTVEFIDELAERGRKVVHREAEEIAEITEANKEITQAKPAAKARTAQRKPAAKKTDA
ncbi:hypothetical protein [Spirillospora albida]|uniref:hypothetical protein n=1 Tax=Spirillospora albida TaxID=58123 RepID=UPI0004C070B5|nr:hypothetical protein [Spirillospora albida]